MLRITLAELGKDIRNTKTKTINNKEVNIKTINYTADGEIIATKFTASEQTYIKDNLESDLIDLSKKLKSKKKSY